MFSGIVTALGKIKQIINRAGCVDFIIDLTEHFPQLSVGESIAINGVCLTVTHFLEDTIQVTAVPETLRVTNLGQLVPGSRVNLERAITLNTRLGGHYVQGHVDGVGEILHLQTEGETALLVKIGIPAALAKYLVPKGYITLDGMSITVIDCGTTWFTVTFIPHTQQVTIVSQYYIGSKINLEVDILAKYTASLLGASLSCNPVLIP
jgi:riboflavin synthase